jgi:hypothetical protein
MAKAVHQQYLAAIVYIHGKTVYCVHKDLVWKIGLLFEKKCPHFWPTELLKETRVGVKAGGVQNGVLSLVEPQEQNNL